jgi:predicted RNase H-like HicB family nuclease
MLVFEQARRILRHAQRRFEMKIKIVLHDAEEGGFWAEVPAIPGCVSQGDAMEELIANIHEAIEGCLSVDGADG